TRPLTWHPTATFFPFVRDLAPTRIHTLSLHDALPIFLATRIERPFSYRTYYNGFPHRTVILDRQGRELVTLVHQPLREGGGGGFGGAGGGDGMRNLSWRPDGAGLVFVKRAPRDPSAGADAPRPDRVYLLTAPWDTAQAQLVVESEDPIRSVVFSLDG